MLQASNPPSPTPSPAASLFARINGGGAAAPPGNNLHPRSFSAGAEGGPSGQGEGSGSVTPPPSVGGGNLRRAVSLRGAANSGLSMSGMSSPAPMSSFAAAGSDLASSPASSSSDYVPPAAARHPLFSHHAVAPRGQVPRPFSPAFTVMSEPGHIGDDSPFDSDMTFPPSPTGSTVSSGAFSPASAVLSHFYGGPRGRAGSIAGTLATEPPPPDAQGAIVLDYRLGKVLGRGGFSTVREATHTRTGEVIACKIVKRADLSDESGSVAAFEDEIKMWKALPHHPSLLPFMDMHRTPYATFLFMPLLPGGSLLEVLRREGGSDKTARKWFPGVVTAVSALHEGFDGFPGRMLHGDLKLDNFMADHSGGLRLGDFGMAKILPEDTLSVPTHKPNLPSHLSGRSRISSAPSNPRSRGRQMSRSPNRRRDTFAQGDVAPDPSQPFPSASLPYAPPELLCAPPSQPTLKQDIWAVGIILYALLTGKLPFSDSFDPRLQMKILRGQWDEPLNLGNEWLEALYGTLERDLHVRWDIQRLRASDAVTGWRQVRTHKSRSRSRARMTPSSADSLPDAIPIPGSRDRSRSRLRHAASGSLSGLHHRGPHDIPSPRDDRDSRFLRRAGLESRSRSASSSRQAAPRGRLNMAEVHSRLASSMSDDRLANALDDVSISRGRREFRDGETPTQESRDASSSSVNSLRVPDSGSHEPGRRPHTYHAPNPGHMHAPHDNRRTRSRTRADGVTVTVPGSGPPTPREAQLLHHGPNSPSSPYSGVNTPPTKGRARGSPAWAADSRPPTLGIELDVVDEEERGRRGRSPRR